jgi:alkylhydroperoxidase/carboxymuconolactone decarboxylase family protein YurZ
MLHLNSHADNPGLTDREINEVTMVACLMGGNILDLYSESARMEYQLDTD